MNFKLTELENLFKKIMDIISFIETSSYSTRRQQIYFSNGDRITISTSDDSIAHLLGIDINYLRSTGLYRKNNSFELLKEMSSNAYTIYNAHSHGIIQYDKLFSKYINNKIEGFKQNLKIDVNFVEVVCKYNSEKCYLSGELIEKYDYIIIKKYEDGKIGILGLINNGGYYAPMSNQLYDCFEDAKPTIEKYLKNQDILLITGIKLYNINSDYKHQFHPYLTSKEEKFNILKTYKQQFNCTIDVSGEYDFCLDKIMTRRDIEYKDNDLIDIIVNSIKQGKLININDIDTSLKPIIDEFNNYLCNNQNTPSEAKENYTSLKDSLKELKGKLLTAESTINNLTSQNTSLENQNQKLTEENQMLKENEQKIFEIIKPRIS